MKKNTIKAFTLVEMLIVIVIIGILIASLMPRMQSAQWRARDVARKNDLSQIQTAIITSQADRGAWPGMVWNTWETITGATSVSGALGLPVGAIAKNLQAAWMTQIPTDPNGSNEASWLWSFSASDNMWEYAYLVWTRNWIANAWFALMAKTEVEGSSNWVVCDGATSWLWSWIITSSDDLAHVTLCSSVSQSSTCASNKQDCTYKETWELRYILLY
jgi:prepilin-type N-terminal cleavage/methylation domain-containing protein